MLSASQTEGDKAYKAAMKRFHFPEVNEINLGFSKGNHGSAFGPALSRQILKDAKEIIDTGSKEPEIFHLISLFEDDVGPDRISDMIARIIYDDIVEYTKYVNETLNINIERYPHQLFADELMSNPYKKSVILLLPKDILHELPIARDWDDIDRVCRENEAIRAEMNDLIAEQWNKIATSDKKRYIREHIFKKPENLSRVIDKYRSTSVPAYDFYEDRVGDYQAARFAKTIVNKENLVIDKSISTSYEVAKIICDQFKDLVENNKAYELFYSDSGKARGEKIIQRAFFIIAVSYCDANNLDISPESNAGRGPVDFKFSQGLDKTIVEIKLTTNPNLFHGFQTQIEQYSKAEKTNQKIYLIVHNGGPQKRLEQVTEFYTKKKKTELRVPELIVIDARPKESASKYKEE